MPKKRTVIRKKLIGGVGGKIESEPIDQDEVGNAMYLKSHNEC
jgi:hypothetical protein